MNSNNKKFTDKEIKNIAKEYIFSKNISYKKLAEKYGCSDNKISYMMNYDLLEISRFLYVLADLKAKYNKKKAMKKFFYKK